MSTYTVDMQELKAQMKATWMSGDYAQFATYLQPGAMEFLSLVEIPSGSRVLDVACGAGQTAIPLARQGCRVTGVDIATNLVEAARRRARDAELPAHFDEGDAEELPYPDASFDVVFSLIGAMFAPQPHRVAAEMARVCRPGGQILMGNWTPHGFVGQMFKTLGAHVAPAQGVPSPALWGDEATVRERLSGHVSNLHISMHSYPLVYPFNEAEVVDHFIRLYGPVNRAYRALDREGRAALRGDLEALWTAYNRAADGTVRVGAEYMVVTALNRQN